NRPTDWAAEWAEAKRRYESAEKALDAALKQEPRDSDVIEFLTQRMQNAQKDKELLLQRSQPSEETQARLRNLENQLVQIQRFQKGDSSAGQSSHGEAAAAFSRETMRACKELYPVCALCGLDDSRCLSVAYIATKTPSYQTSNKGRQFARTFHFDDVRNSIRLCTGFTGACHGLFDDDGLALVPGIDGGRWTIVCSSGDWAVRLSVAKNGRVWKRYAHHDFQRLSPEQMPYRRVLADRYKNFIDSSHLHFQNVLTHWETVCELSAAQSEDEESVEHPAKRARVTN
ncbi:unnamed protein product, partial [Symbiodinium sp. CCMP2456]